MKAMIWRVYGREGHRQRESFYDSFVWDFSNEEVGTRILIVRNADITGTNEYTEVEIWRDTKELCEDEFLGQLSDGIFENSNVGRIELVTDTFTLREKADY